MHNRTPQDKKKTENAFLLTNPFNTAGCKSGIFYQNLRPHLICRKHHPHWAQRWKPTFANWKVSRNAHHWHKHKDMATQHVPLSSMWVILRVALVQVWQKQIFFVFGLAFGCASGKPTTVQTSSSTHKSKFQWLLALFWPYCEGSYTGLNS